MAATRRTSRSRFILLLLVLTAGTIITLDYRGHGNALVNKTKSIAHDIYTPVQSGLSHALRPVGNFFSGAFGYGALKSQNSQLQRQIAELRGRAATDQGAAQQLQHVLALSHLPYAGTIPSVAAEVMDNTFGNFQLTVEIDRGSHSGVRLGNIVVSGEGLVGRVVSVSRSTSDVLVLTDPSFQVGVRTGGFVGVASGQGAGHNLRVDLIPPEAAVHKGDVMLTSGEQGSIFPAGIPIGKVTSVTQRPDALQEDVTISPLVTLDTVQFVEVLEYQPPGLP
jgi:rod shape-determining protein MreC